MAYHYVSADRDQLLLLPTSMSDWLEEGHLAWFVIEVVGRVDTAALHARHPNDGPGRPAYDPDMMLALLLYAYGAGLRSSRRIEAACGTDAAFRVITGGLAPDHATIARFLVDHEAAIEAVFVEVLRLCAAAGLVSVDTLAVDGTRMGADAALDVNRTRGQIEAELERLRGEVAAILAEARAADAAEGARGDLFGLAEAFGSGRLPEGLASRAQRQARLEQALAVVEAEDAAAAEAAAQQTAAAARAAAEGRLVNGRKPKDPRAALTRAELDAATVAARVDAARAERAARRDAKLAQAAAEARAPGPLPSPRLRRRERQQLDRADQRLADARAAAADAAPPDRRANTTDPDSRIMKSRHGWVQGYNAQAVVNEHQVVLACAVTADHNDAVLFQPMLAHTQAALTAAGVSDQIGVVLADAGYWSEANATAEGPDRLIATSKDWRQRRAARDLGATSGPPPAHAPPLEAMEHRLRTPEGTAAYAQRSHLVEPVFGHAKANQGWRHFRRRGLPAVNSEWALINTSHNIAKLFNAHDTSPAPAPS